MRKSKTAYHCQACGTSSPQWAGYCADCGAWNTLLETQEPTAAAHPRQRGAFVAPQQSSIKHLSEMDCEATPRFDSGLSELDRVLGGGLVPGSVVLIGGDPGIGKSTVLLQSMSHLSTTHPVLYVTGEESLQQVSLRAQRLGVSDANIHLLSETQVERILSAAQQQKPRVMVIDSIQTVYTDTLQSAPGGVSQVRESAAQLVQYAKATGTALFLVGHVTKEGALAGPRVLEHMVDTVLYFEGERDSRYRVIRAVKNRFGAVNELGIFSMTDKGLREVANPSAIFLSRHEKPVPGSVILVTWEGSRPMLVEIQALVDQSHMGHPRRVTVGVDPNRLTMGLAVLHRHGGVATYDQDVFVNAVGGARILETGIDLAVILSVLSSLRNRPLPHDLVVFGEIGLAGEIRPVQGGQERLREASKHGFKRAIVPRANIKQASFAGMTVHPVVHIQEALDALADM